MHLDAPDADAPSAGLERQLVALADRARPERSRDDGPDSLKRERAIGEQTCRGERRVPLDAAGDLVQRVDELGDPLSRPGARGDDWCAGNEIAALLDRQLPHVRIDGVDLRDRDDAVLDPEQAHDRQVLVGLRPCAFGCVDDEQEEVDAGGAGHHVPDEALVARDVDHRDVPPARQLERRVAEVDGDAALLLLRQAVGVLAGQRPDEPGLAVVDVSRRPEDQRRVAHPAGAVRARETARATSSTSASRIVRQSR